MPPSSAWLREHDRWLLILDNVDTQEAKEAVLEGTALPLRGRCPHYLPTSGTGPPSVHKAAPGNAQFGRGATVSFSERTARATVLRQRKTQRRLAAWPKNSEVFLLRWSKRRRISSIIR